MRRFLLKTAAVLLVLPAPLLLLWILIDLQIDSSTTPDRTTAVIGTSIVARSWNDSMIAGTDNIALDGEPYFYSYPKLKRYLNQNRHTERLLIEVIPNFFPSFRDTMIGSEKYITFHLPKFALRLGGEGWRTLLQERPLLFQLYPTLMQKSWETFYRKESFRYGGYNPLDRERMEEILNRNDTAELSLDSTPLPYNSIAPINLRYLHSIVRHAEKKGIEVSFLRIPLHPLFKGNRYEEAMKELLRKEFPSVELLDFHRFPLKDEEFGDLTHLNHTGADRFSLWVNQLIENGLWEAADKQAMIDAAIEQADN